MPAKRYFSNIPNQSFYFSDGVQGIFANGFMDVDSLRYQAELDAILGKQTTIYTPEKPHMEQPKVMQNAATEAEIAQATQNIQGKVVTTIDTAGIDNDLAKQMQNATFDSEAAADQANANMAAENPTVTAAKARLAAK